MNFQFSPNEILEMLFVKKNFPKIFQIRPERKIEPTLLKIKKKIFVLSLFSVLYDLFRPDLPKSLAKISQRPENRKDWSK